VRTFWNAESIERVTKWKPEGRAATGIIHLTNSGACSLDLSGEQTKDGKPVCKPFWEITDEEVEKCMEATPFANANLEYFRAGGFCSNFKTKDGMPLTMVRVNYIKNLGPVIQIAEGWSVALPDDVQKILADRTDPQWPQTWFSPRLTGTGAFKDAYSVMANWGANHCAFTYGHIGADLITLASMLRIPVCMHNVDEDKIFRPSTVAAFGMDKEGADFRYCQAYGPIYR
jgi:L-fucose isomerase